MADPQIDWDNTDPTKKPHALLVLDDTTPTGTRIPVVPIVVGGVVVLGVILGIVLGTGGGSTPTTHAGATPPAGQTANPGVGAAGTTSIIKGGVICFSSQPPPSQGPTSQGSSQGGSTQGPSTPGATGQSQAVYVEVKVSTDPPASGPWVMRLDSVGSGGATNVNATSAIMMSGAGTFTISLPQPGTTFQTISFVNAQSQIIDGGPFDSRFPLTVQNANEPCITVP